ncbi:transporter substrate-binding domain-containing protein [Rhizobium leguminosarum bv. viciae]|nr:transporter substrate-binding domain-containing protein [Rhizobium leguminosarum bv. viciae]
MTTPARAFAKSLGLEIKFTNLSLAARIPSLVSQKVDIIISGLGITAERAKSVQFSAPYLETKMYVIAGKDKKIASPDDLAGVAVGVPRSSTIDTLLTAASPKATDIRRFDDDASNIQSLMSGQVEAIGANQFYSDRLSTIQPGVYENKFSIGSTWYGAATRPGEKDWNEAFNSFIFKFRTTKEFADIYKTWVKSDVPRFPNDVDGVSFPKP